MIERFRLCWRLVLGQARAEPDVFGLAATLVGLPVLAYVAASRWALAWGFWIAVAVVVLVEVALSATEDRRRDLEAHLWVEGASRSTRVELSALSALLLGGIGTVGGVVLGAPIGLAVSGDLRTTVIAGAAALASGAAGSVAVVARSVLGETVLRRRSATGRLARRRRPRWEIGGVGVTGAVVFLVAVAVLVWSTWAVGHSRTFFDLSLGVLLASPFAVAAVLAVAPASLRLLVLIERRTTGPLWFALRSLRRDRSRTGPLVGLVAVAATVCTIAAVFGASFDERVHRAQVALDRGETPVWFDPDGDGPLFDLEAMRAEAEQQAALGNPTALEEFEALVEALGLPDEPSVAVPDPLKVPDATTLADSELILDDGAEVWAFVGLGALVLVPVVAVAVSLGAAARRHDDELLAIQGADRSFAARLTRWEGGVLAGLGSAVGVVIGLATTVGGFAVYDETSRIVGDQVYPPIPWVVPWEVVAALLVVVPAVAASLAGALVRPPTPDVLGRRVELTPLRA